MKERRIYELMIGKLLEVAENNPDGFTVRLPTLDFVKSGWVIAMAETQNCHGYEGMERAIGAQ
ncbi:hypothetical protein [Chitinophaga sp. sic0106]|uniref:hypothetical protein n=1 Tax=Chitinophaga sp. sic0106 TaxID=2854785 RepID=UPI001C470568|nr:hypothetical protein [Chitinophaga sp. sic0106]MBV7531817.1 hypothetical protein [Chitinophaga sp. sic0106]